MHFLAFLLLRQSASAPSLAAALVGTQHRDLARAKFGEDEVIARVAIQIAGTSAMPFEQIDD
jgi:hypothetical protein